MKKKVAIVGGGVSGLVAVKCCLDEGLEPVCFEQHDDIGGVWYYTENPRPNQGAAGFKNLITNVSKESMSFSDFKMREDFPQYMHHSQYLDYLRDYAKNFQLLQYINFNTEVMKVAKAENYSEMGCWTVVVRKNDQRLSSAVYDAVIICTGNTQIPQTPHIPGIFTDFKGTVLHMHTYRTNDDFKDKTVLVVGNQNSAGDAAVDISNVAKQVYLSVGDGTTVVSRYGKQEAPIELQFGTFAWRTLMKIPGGLKRGVQDLQKTSGLFMQRKYGLANDNTRLPFHGGALMVNDELKFKVFTDRVKCMERLVGFQDNTALFSDGQKLENVDMVLFATGYNFSVPFVEDEVIQGLGKNRVTWPVYKWVFPLHLDHPTLAFILATPGAMSQPLVAELQARWITAAVSGVVKLPTQDKMKRYQLEQQEAFQSRTLGRIQPILIQLYESIAEELDAVPSTVELLRNWIGFSPILPPLYRIRGHGARPDGLEMYRSSVNRAWNTPVRKYQKTPRQPVFIFIVAASLLSIVTWLVVS